MLSIKKKVTTATRRRPHARDVVQRIILEDMAPEALRELVGDLLIPDSGLLGAIYEVSVEDWKVPLDKIYGVCQSLALFRNH